MSLSKLPAVSKSGVVVNTSGDVTASSLVAVTGDPEMDGDVHDASAHRNSNRRVSPRMRSDDYSARPGYSFFFSLPSLSLMNVRICSLMSNSLSHCS